VRACLRKFGRQIRGFVSRDRTGHPKHDAFVGEDGHVASLYFQEKVSQALSQTIVDAAVGKLYSVVNQ